MKKISSKHSSCDVSPQKSLGVDCVSQDYLYVATHLMFTNIDVQCAGTTTTFRAYGLICIIVLAIFVFINFYRKDTGFVSELPQTEDPHQVAEATHLAPHGVPSNAIPRALSSSRLHELANQDAGYGATYQTSGGNLAVPGANGGEVSIIFHDSQMETFLRAQRSVAIFYRLRRR